MDKTLLEDLGADFYNFMIARDYKGARGIVDQLAENGMYEDALIFLRAVIGAEMKERMSV